MTLNVKTLEKTENGPGPLGLCPPVPIHIECDAFTGSLAALFQIARQGRIDMLEVPLQPICNAYVAYLMDHQGGDLDAAASALLALAYLLERKAFQLLPVPEVEEPEEWRDEPSYEPLAFGPLVHALSTGQAERESRFFRAEGPAPYELPYELGGVTADDLARAFERLLRLASPEPPELLARPRRSLADQMLVVMKALRTEPLPLDTLVEPPFTRTEAVWWFLALLELVRLGEARVSLVEGEALFGLNVYSS